MGLHYLVRGARAEMLKIKRSLVLIAALSIPLFPAFANIATTLHSGLGRALDEPDLAPWSLYIRYSIKLWTIFAMPIVVAILSALLANVEHKPKTWKQLFALPFPRAGILFGKWLILAGITLLSTLVLAVATLAGGLFIHFVRPELGLLFPIPIAEAFTMPLLGWLLSMFMLSIHLWISLRWSSFLVSITVGFAASVSNIFFISSYLFEKSALSPWAMPVQAYGDWPATLLAALIGAMLVYLLTRSWFIRRDVY